MSLKINEYCIACGWCQPLCKNGAIKEGDNMRYVIDANRCTECVGWFEEPRCVEVCFLSAIEPDPGYVESREQLVAKWQRLHPRLASQVT